VFDLDSTLHTTGSPAVILVTGVNGAGKTSSIAKLANMLKLENRTVLLVAADTFRAGAIDQLAILADRAGVPVMRSVEGQDPSSVVFNGLQKAVADRVDVVVIDTAGRLENKKNLTFELQKVVRVIETKFGLPLSSTRRPVRMLSCKPVPSVRRSRSRVSSSRRSTPAQKAAV
jgi:fused signal recognition particle receptor